MPNQPTILNTFEQIVYDTLCEFVNLRQANRVAPESGTVRDILRGLEPLVIESLRSLYLKKLVTFHQDLNGVQWFGITPQEL